MVVRLRMILDVWRMMMMLRMLQQRDRCYGYDGGGLLLLLQWRLLSVVSSSSQVSQKPKPRGPSNDVVAVLEKSRTLPTARQMMPASRGRVVAKVQSWGVVMLRVLTLMVVDVGCGSNAEDADGNEDYDDYAMKTRTAKERFVVDQMVLTKAAVGKEEEEEEEVQVHDAMMCGRTNDSEDPKVLGDEGSDKGLRPKKVPEILERRQSRMVPKRAPGSMHRLELHRHCWHPSEADALELTSLGLRYLIHNDCLDVVVVVPRMDVMGIGAMRLLNHIDDVDEVGNGPADEANEQSETTGLPGSACAAESAGNSRGGAEMLTMTPPVRAHPRIA